MPLRKLSVHMILCYDVFGETTSAGRWREENTGAYWRSDEPSKHFSPFDQVPEDVGQLSQNLRLNLGKAKKERAFDPYEIAARYGYRFANISPFEKGNGQICRLVMNIILLKYAGHSCSFGINEAEKHLYLGVVVRSGQKCHEEDLEILEKKTESGTTA